MTQSTEQNSTSGTFPRALRERPEIFIGETGRHGVYYLVDHLLRSLIWGSDREALGRLSISVETDGTLKLDRTWSESAEPFPSLSKDLPAQSSLMGALFSQCVQGIQQAGGQRLDWIPSNPFMAIYLAVAVALSSKATVCMTSPQVTLVQTYRDGEPVSDVQRGSGGPPRVVMEVGFESTFLGEDVPAYPFRVRLRELATLLPGLVIDVQYKGFTPVEYQSGGVRDLLEFYVPEDDRFHPEPFLFDYHRDGLHYTLALFLIRSEMERIKSFAGLDEAYHGGLHEKVLRRTVREVVKRLHKIEPPIRRQTCDNVASSRMTYFGKFGATVPYRRDDRRTEYVRTVPGLAATLHVDCPDLEWETNYRARLTGPDRLKAVRSDLTVEFRRWILDNPKAVRAWNDQWAPKKKGRKTSKPKPAATGEKEE